MLEFSVNAIGIHRVEKKRRSICEDFASHIRNHMAENEELRKFNSEN